MLSFHKRSALSVAISLGLVSAAAQAQVQAGPKPGGPGASPLEPKPASSPSPAASANSPLRMSQTSSPGTPGRWYAGIEFRHHTSTYYDRDGSYAHQTPSMHARVQMGAQFHGGLLDLYGTFGAYKLADTQQVLQRRPEAALDVRPFRHENFEFVQYNVVQFPFASKEADPETPEETLDQGSVYTFGLASTAKAPFMASNWRIEPKVGFDGWTRLYSRKQYTSDYKRGSNSDEEEGRLGLDEEADPNSEPIEDRALHYDFQTLGGFSVKPGFAPNLTNEWTVHHHSKFRPEYENYESGPEYTYAAERYSFYRARLQWDIDDRWMVANDFYQFFDEFFAAKRQGEDRRYRNVARISCKL